MSHLFDCHVKNICLFIPKSTIKEAVKLIYLIDYRNSESHSYALWGFC